MQKWAFASLTPAPSQSDACSIAIRRLPRRNPARGPSQSDACSVAIRRPLRRNPTRGPSQSDAWFLAIRRVVRRNPTPAPWQSDAWSVVMRRVVRRNPTRAPSQSVAKRIKWHCCMFCDSVFGVSWLVNCLRFWYHRESWGCSVLYSSVQNCSQTSVDDFDLAMLF